MQAYNYVGPLYGGVLKEGDGATLLISTYADGTHTATVFEYNRMTALAIIVGLFLIATVAVELGIKLSILGADTRNVDGKAFGAMLVSLPEEEEKRKAVLDYLNDHEGVTAEVIQ